MATNSSALTWDDTGARLYETGTSKGVIYPKSTAGTYPTGIAWNGLISVSENPSGAEASPLYADNIKYLNLVSAEEFGATIEAYTYPTEFEACDGSASPAVGVSIGQQRRQEFGFCYRTVIGNDVSGDDHGYKLHLIYNCLASPSEKSYSSINDSPEAITFSWDLTTTPEVLTSVDVDGKVYKPTACITIDSTKVSATKLVALETVLYGSDSAEAKLLSPDEIIAMMTETTDET